MVPGIRQIKTDWHLDIGGEGERPGHHRVKFPVAHRGQRGFVQNRVAGGFFNFKAQRPAFRRHFDGQHHGSFPAVAKGESGIGGRRIPTIPSRPKPLRTAAGLSDAGHIGDVGLNLISNGNLTRIRRCR